MEDVKIPHDALLPKSGGLGSPFSCLNNARYGISWGVMGALEDCIARSREYALERYVTSTQLSQYLHVQETIQSTFGFIPASPEEIRRCLGVRDTRSSWLATARSIEGQWAMVPRHGLDDEEEQLWRSLETV